MLRLKSSLALVCGIPLKITSPICETGLDLIFFIVQLNATGRSSTLFKYKISRFYPVLQIFSVNDYKNLHLDCVVNQKMLISQSNYKDVIDRRTKDLVGRITVNAVFFLSLGTKHG